MCKQISMHANGYRNLSCSCESERVCMYARFWKTVTHAFLVLLFVDIFLPVSLTFKVAFSKSMHSSIYALRMAIIIERISSLFLSASREYVIKAHILWKDALLHLAQFNFTFVNYFFSSFRRTVLCFIFFLARIFMYIQDVVLTLEYV